MGCEKEMMKPMVCEYSHQTGMMSVSDVEWVIGERTSYESGTALCVTRSPGQCAERGCCKWLAWGKITTLYYSREKSDVNTLIGQLAEKQWNIISCLDGVADVCDDGYFVCLLSKE